MMRRAGLVIGDLPQSTLALLRGREADIDII